MKIKLALKMSLRGISLRHANAGFFVSPQQVHAMPSATVNESETPLFSGKRCPIV